MKPSLIVRIVLMFGLISILFATRAYGQTPTSNGSAADIAWSPEGGLLAVSGNFGLVLYDSDFQLNDIITDEYIKPLAWSPNGIFLAGIRYLNGTFEIILWNQTDHSIETIQLASDTVRELVWSPDSQHIAAITYQGISIYEIATRTLVLTLSSPSPIEDAAWSPDGSRIAAVGGGIDTPALIKVWEASTGNLEFSIGTTGTEQFYDISAMAWDPESTKIALGIGPSEKGAIPILDVASQTISRGYDLPLEPFTFIGWSPDGTRFAAADAGITGSTLYMWNASNQERLWFMHLSDFDNSYVGGTWKPDSNQLAMLIKTFTNNIPQTSVHILDAETGVEITVLELPAVTPTPTPTATPDPCTAYPATVPDLISAITTANTTSGLDTLCLAAGTYTFTTTHIPLNALPAISSEITILGNGATLTRQVGSALFGFFEVSAGGSLTLENLTLNGGDVGNDTGGALVNEGGDGHAR
ncbi:MAG: PD40 domain-containing protein [Anaerolineae bacterium]|nr:PD40 domain-containing protein [Anaerolineae bacterium]